MPFGEQVDVGVMADLFMVAPNRQEAARRIAFIDRMMSIGDVGVERRRINGATGFDNRGKIDFRHGAPLARPAS